MSDKAHSSAVASEPPHDDEEVEEPEPFNSFGIDIAGLTFTRYANDDGIPVEFQEPAAAAAPATEEPADEAGHVDAAEPAAADSSAAARPTSAATARPQSAIRRLNVVDAYGKRCGPDAVETDTQDVIAALDIEAPDTETTMIVVDGVVVGEMDAQSSSPRQKKSTAPAAAAAPSPGSAADPDRHNPLTLAQPLSIDPVPVRVPRAVQQGTRDEAMERSRASLAEAVKAVERAAEKIAPLKEYFRTWRRRGDGSEVASSMPELFAEYYDPLVHSDPLAPVRAVSAPANANAEAKALAALEAMCGEEGADPSVVPFFESTAVRSEFFMLAVASVLASNGHDADDADDSVPEDAAAVPKTPPFPAPRGDIFTKWFANAEHLPQHELLTCRFFVVPGSTWEHRHDSSPAAQPDSSTPSDSLAIPSHFVTVDTLLPAAEDRRPAFGRTEEPTEMWLSLLMKAYAVAHPQALGVAALHKDSPAAALEALTGGSVSQAHWSMDDPAAVGMVWWLLQLCAQYRLPCMMCRRPMRESDDDDGDDDESDADVATHDNDSQRPRVSSSEPDGATPLDAAADAPASKPRPGSRATFSQPPSSRAASSHRPRSPGGAAGSSESAPVAIDDDGEVERFVWEQGDVLLTAREYRLDTGIAEALAQIEDPDGDARSVSSAATGLTASAFNAGGSSSATEVHRLVKLRQLYGTSRNDDETGWLPPWHDEANSWSDVITGNLGATTRSRATSVLSSVTSMSVRSGAASRARWTKATRRALQHPSPDERVAWMDAALFAGRYNTLMVARNLAQQPHHRLHFGVVDRTVRREDSAEMFPAIFVEVKKRDTGARSDDAEDWRTAIEEKRNTGVADLLADVNMDADFGFCTEAAEGAAVETDDEAVDEDSAANDDDGTMSSSSRVSANEAPGARRSTTGLVLRVTVSQPARTAAPTVQSGPGASARGGSSLRSEMLGNAQSGPRAVPAPPPPQLEMLVLRAVERGRVPCVRAMASDGTQYSALPTHGRIAAPLVSTRTTQDAIEAVYEVEVNTGYYNFVVCPPAADDIAGLSLSHVASTMAKQPFAVAVAMVRNAPSYEVSTSAL